MNLVAAPGWEPGPPRGTSKPAAVIFLAVTVLSQRLPQELDSYESATDFESSCNYL